MWFDGIRQPNTIYVANVSRGKDSTAMLRAIRLMGWPLDAIVSVDIWATQDIPAELPPMVEFKDEWDRKCLENFGVPVTRLCATKRERERERERDAPRDDGECHSRKWSYESEFYHILESGKFVGTIKGFPKQQGSWCKKLKIEQVDLRGYLLSQGVAAETETERERMAARQKPERKHPDAWISDATGRMVQQRPQTRSNHESTDFPDCQRWEDHNGVQENSRRERRTYGFATRNCPWCQSCLKGAKLDNPFPMSARTRRRK